MPEKKRRSIYKDPRVTAKSGGASHDWIHTASQEDAEALIEEYQPQVKYRPQQFGDGHWEFAIH